MPERTVAEVLSAYEAACAMLPRPINRQAAAQPLLAGSTAPSRAAMPGPVAALCRLGLCRPVWTAGRSSAQPLNLRGVAADGGLRARLAAAGLGWRGAFGRGSRLLRSLATHRIVVAAEPARAIKSPTRPPPSAFPRCCR
jgi:hypothetical protein